MCSNHGRSKKCVERFGGFGITTGWFQSLGNLKQEVRFKNGCEFVAVIFGCIPGFPLTSSRVDALTNISIVLLFAGLKMNPKISPGSLMNLDGALSCFFIVYLIFVVN